MSVPSIPRSPQRGRRDSERRRLIDWRTAMPQDERESAEQALVQHVVALLEPVTAGVLALYWPIQGEPDLRLLAPRLRDRGWTVALPKVSGRDQPLQFGRWDAAHALLSGGFGVMLPDPFEPVAPDLLILPCVGFSEHRYRLGYGGGYYDRTLAAHPVMTVGVAFEGAALDGFEPEPHDRRLDCIVTEGRILGALSARDAQGESDQD